MRYITLILLLLITPIVKADSWTYTGNSENHYSMNPFLAPAANPCACALDGTVTFNSAGVASSWDFTANGETFTNLNSTLGGWFGFLDPQPFNWWHFELDGGDGTIRSIFMGSLTDAFDKDGLGLDVGSNPGHWSLVATSESSTLSLLLTGVVVFLFLRRR